MDLIEIKGKINTAICYARVVEDEAIEQIRRMCDYPMTEGSRIRIMPDVHSGKGCTIGTTMTITDKAVPNVVGVDIGCGLYTVNLGKVDIDFEFDLLMMFIKNKGIAFSRDKILENVWDENYFGSDRVVDDTLRRLRKKLPNLNIHTIYGYGYRLG